MTLHNTTRNTLITTLLLATISAQIIAADLTVTVSPVKVDSGQVMLAVYNSEETFRETVHTAQRATAKNGEMVFTFSNLDASDYAVMVIHDENENDKLDTNLLGMPSEPWGGSLQGKRVFGAPGWSDTRFELPEAGLSLAITLH